MQRISLAGFSYPAGATRSPGRTCPARKYDLAGDLRVLESETARVYSLIRPPRTGRTGGQRGACARWVPKTSSRSCDQAIFVDQATDATLSCYAVLLKIDRFG